MSVGGGHDAHAQALGRATCTEQPGGRFDATTVSSTNGTIQWHGRIEGNRLQGEALWLKPGEAPMRYRIQGTLK